MDPKLNLKGRVDLQEDPSTSCSAAQLNDEEGGDGADEACHCKKCKAQQILTNWWESCLAGNGSVGTAVCPQSEGEELEDFPSPVFSTQQESPPLSPLRLESPPTPGSEDVNFVLKEENDPCTSLESSSIIMSWKSNSEDLESDEEEF